jgi:hypothetical protein
MPTTDARIIPLSAAKLQFLMYASLTFLAGGVWFWFFPERFPRYAPELVKAVAALAAGSFAISAVWFAVKLRDPGPGLVIDAEGLIDRSSGVAAGRIPWADIKGFKVHQIQSQQFLAVLVRDPERYLARANPLLRAAVRINLSQFGSPIQISAVALDIDFEDLVSAVTAAHRKHQAK